VLDQGTLEKLQGETPVAEGAELQVKLVEVGRHDVGAGIAKLDGYTVSVGDGASQIGKTVKVRVERFVDGTAYAMLVSKGKEPLEPITAEGQAEKPTRKPPARKTAKAEAAVAEESPPAEAPASEEEAEPAAGEPAEAPKPRKKTRRGSRGGRGRKKKTATATEAAAAQDGAAPEPKIHLPDASLGQESTKIEAEAPTPNGEAQSDETEAPKPRKKTRRGSRGGRNRRKKATAASSNGGDDAVDTEDSASDEYVPMAEWIDEVETS
jgi:predicted RNA-binding protein with TRAM domain